MSLYIVRLHEEKEKMLSEIQNMSQFEHPYASQCILGALPCNLSFPLQNEG
jgi:hypothetical protein